MFIGFLDKLKEQMCCAKLTYLGAYLGLARSSSVYVGRERDSLNPYEMGKLLVSIPNFFYRWSTT